MVVIAAGGIALAALLGILVARTALAPIARFTRQTEAIAAQPRAARDTSGSRSSATTSSRGSARTFNATLDALERSVRVAAQPGRRRLARAAHADRVDPREPPAAARREPALRGRTARRCAQDMIEELDELTALVGDVVELARGSRPSGEPGDVRLDEIVASSSSARGGGRPS